MTHLVLPLSNSYQSVERNIQLSVMQHLRDLMSLPDGTKLLDLPPEMSEKQLGSEMDKMDTRTGEYLISVGDRIQAEWRNEIIDTEGLTATVHRTNHKPVFEDPELGVVMKPSYQKIKSTADITIRFRSKDQAFKWYNSFNTKLSMGLQQITHTANYHYPIPPAMVLIIQEIYRLRELKAGYGETIQKYIRDHSTPNLTSIMDQAGGNRTMAIQGTQHEILGDFEFRELVPKPEPQEPNGVWFSNFSYTIYYEQPVAMSLKYPILVHNSLMPQWALDNTRQYDIDRLFNTYGSMGQHALRNHLIKANMYHTNISGFRGLSIPSFDYWRPTYVHPSEIVLIMAAIAVDEDDPTLVMDLNDLGSYKFKDEVLAWLRSQGDRAKSLSGGPIKIYLYRHDIPLEQNYITIDENLIVRSKTPLDLRKFYHVVITLQFDWTLLPEEVKLDLCKHGEFTRGLISLLAGPHRNDILPPVRNGVIEYKDLTKAIGVITERQYARRAPGTYGFYLVAALTVEAGSR